MANFKALLSLEIFSNSIIRLSYGANPTISLTRSLVNLVRLYNFYKEATYNIDTSKEEYHNALYNELQRTHRPMSMLNPKEDSSF